MVLAHTSKPRVPKAIWTTAQFFNREAGAQISRRGFLEAVPSEKLVGVTEEMQQHPQNAHHGDEIRPGTHRCVV